VKPKRMRKIFGTVAFTATVAAVLPVLAEASSTSGSPLGYDAKFDAGSMSLVSTVVGAQPMWEKGFTGKGVDVAVIDTGVSRVSGLNGAGKIIDGPDLSFDSQSIEFAHRDSFGHGTIMASIIAGADSVGSNPRCRTCLVASPYSDTRRFVGIAPGARILNVKVGAFDGATDVSQVIAAIDWVVQHRDDKGMHVRVINLSYGTDSTQPGAVDPLVYATDVAWRRGIVVVASAGNDGLTTTSVADPASNPNIIAVGASDTNGTVAIDDDVIPVFAQHGNEARRVDVVAPGSHILGLKVPGSFIDANVMAGNVGSRFQRTSGTAAATAVVSGVVALLLQKYPDATPDQVKALLTTTAAPVVATSTVPAELRPIAGQMLPRWQGAGVVNADQAAGLPLSAAATVATAATAVTGTGTLEGARGTTHLLTNGVSLSGEIDALANPWDGAQWAVASRTGKTWDGGEWNGVVWSGDGSSGAHWTTAIWSGIDWSGVPWTLLRYSSMSWNGSRWSGIGWDGIRWSAGPGDTVRWSVSSWG
jgi:serine protease AprX